MKEEFKLPNLPQIKDLPSEMGIAASLVYIIEYFKNVNREKEIYGG